DGMDILKRDERSGEISKDSQHDISDEVQNLTDSFIRKIAALLESKEQEILQV
ncbi:uncharacterized protein METZ01_LOCUS468626, partial [marine metagenome]